MTGEFSSGFVRYRRLAVAEAQHLAQRRDRAAVADDLETVYNAFPILRERAHANAGALSGGQQQMLAIGRGLMARPKLMLLDEPSLGLAPMVLESIRNSLVRLQSSGLSILIAEQNVPWLEGLVHEVVVLGQGRDLIRGSADLLHDRETVKRIYIGA